MPGAATPATALECPSVPRWSFTQGVVLGQASIFILAYLFLKYVVFEDPEKQSIARENTARNRKRATAFPLSGLAPGSDIPTLLSTLAYDLPTHPPETLDWMNVLLAQMIAAYRTLVLSSTTGIGGAVGLMEEMLNRKSGAEGDQTEQGLVGIDRIVVSDVAVGNKFPVLSNARVRPSGDGGVRVELDLDYTDHVSLAISTCLLVNFPRPRFAVLPISLGLTLERFSGTVTVELPSPTSSSPSSIGSTHPTLNFSLHPDFTLELSTTSLLGSRAKLQDVPKVEQLILARLRGWIQDRIVWPGRVQIALPSIASSSSGPHSTPHKVAGQVDGGWEWVEEDEGSDDAPNADSDEEGGARLLPGSGTMTPTVDLYADGGPAVLLHPRIRPRQPGYGSPPVSPVLERQLPPRPPSPSESLPGHYRSSTTGYPTNMDGEEKPVRTGAWQQRGRPSPPQGLRYRPIPGIGAVGVGGPSL